MRIAICGTDDKARKIKSLSDRIPDHNVIIETFIDPEISGSDIDGIPAVSVHELLNRDHSERIVGFIISPEHYGLTRAAIYKKLKASVFYANKKIYMPDYEALHDQDGSAKINIAQILVPYEDSSQLFYLEVHAADHCNADT